ncbi:P-loop containing nucleoside triphosphate hydrolase protein [Pelagophyceae sp. CCMP2097]|nr:P-loop containing nucleoside triphosphate hydrolase protein [Pelagophyceae sp. CCMP2097]
MGSWVRAKLVGVEAELKEHTLLKESSRLLTPYEDSYVEAIEALRKGHDAVVLVATGSGKTAIPACLIVARREEVLRNAPPGAPPPLLPVVIVVTPFVLLALDLVDSLNRRFAVSFAVAMLSDTAKEDVYDGIRNGELDHAVVIVTPGMLALSRATRFFLSDMEAVGRVALIVIDEADCILLTDPEHRPAMLQVAGAIASIRAYSQQDLVDTLRVRPDMYLARTSVIRPNINFNLVQTARGYKAQAADLVAMIEALPLGGGCIVALDCLENGRAVFLVHAKLSQSEKAAALKGFREAQDDAVFICTNSAIRGIDHPNIQHIFKFRLSLCLSDDLQLDGRGARNARIASRSTQMYNRSMLAASFYIIQHSPEAITRFMDVVANAEDLASCYRSLVAVQLGEADTPRAASSSTSCCAACMRVAAVERGECGMLKQPVFPQVTVLIDMCAQHAAANAPATFVQLTRNKEPLAEAWAPSLLESARKRVVAQLMADRTLQLVPADPIKMSGSGLHLRVDHARLQERKKARAAAGLDWRCFTLLPEKYSVAAMDVDDPYDWVL